MKRNLIVEMPDHSLWAVPVMVIANNRAEHYKSEFGNHLERSLAEDTIPLFTDDEYEITDWAVNNMNWSDVKDHATRLPSPVVEVDWEQGWLSGKKRLAD